ncbi:hypothetical protein FBD94_09275 [Pedobacter hiemivivus]|uniref:DoxX family protein n=1 Tax=Pedobacter hiemivivus TaxID=2530454 RepID=A0A4U1GEA0_9SPHI|nr:hypothetical protein [Pedobacter hiemivivus]TCC94696.1 hypothetical protein EZ444_17010 [Pedobacter hiemivivus]TKC62401.1 hypothetical protein FBD94_09275 [Pedobacter hiemivivus]
MTAKIISGLLIGITAYFSFKHGWEALHINNHPAQAQMMNDLGIQKTFIPLIAIVSIAIALLILFPQTFFIGNLMNAFLILTIMALSLKTGNYKTALIEIPFLIMPLLMIWLKHPFKN